MKIETVDMAIPDLAKTATISTAAGRLSVWDTEKNAQTIVFLHGNSSCKEIFIEQFGDPMLASYRLLAIDLPGHGASDNATYPERTYNLPALAQTIAEVLAKLNIQSPIIAGWSLGGHIAIEMAGQGVSMGAMAISGTPPAGPGIKAMENVFLPSTHMALTGKRDFSEEEAILYARHTVGLQRPVTKHLFNALLRTDGRSRELILSHWMKGEQGHDQKSVVSSWPGPIAVFQGKQEPFFSNNYLKKISWRNLWENKIHIIPDSAHAPFWENPGIYNKLLMRFASSFPL